MKKIQCTRCRSNRNVKNGFACNKQGYKCKDCNYQFTRLSPRGEALVKKLLAVLLYGMGRCSFRFIGRLLKVSDVAVYKWVRAFASMLPEPQLPQKIQEIEFDEMWHFIKKKSIKSGFGKPTTVLVGEPLPGLWVVVMKSDLGDYGIN